MQVKAAVQEAPCYKIPCLAGHEKYTGKTEDRKRTAKRRTLLISHAELPGLSGDFKSLLPFGEVGTWQPAAICSGAGAAGTAGTPGAEGRQLPPGRAAPGERKEAAADL